MATKSKIFFFFCLSFISGIFVCSIIKIPWPVMPAFLIFGLAVVSVFWSFKKACIIGFCIVFFSFGLMRYFDVSQKAINNDFKKYSLYGRNIEIIGRIVREPDLRSKSQKLTIGDLKIIIDKKEYGVSGKVILNLRRYPEYSYNDWLSASGKVEEAPVFDKFDYKNYLAKDGIFALMNFPKIEIRKNTSFSLYGGILNIKQKLRQSIYQNFSPPESLILEGTILGDNNALSDELKTKLNITGLRHIIAVSGSHIVMLSGILMSFLLLLGLYRGQAFYFSLLIVISFIIMTGMSASGIRAGVMGGLFLLAQKTGRKNASSRSIVIAGASMLFISPMLLIYDAGFQLSFLASLGIIYLSPLIDKLIWFLKKQEIKSMISVTIASQIFTLPILVFSFGNISLVAPITNLLVLPIAELLMIFGFISAIFGTISNSLGWLFSLPTWLLLNYFYRIIDIFSGPWAMKTVSDVPVIFLCLFYLLLAFLISWLKKRQRFLA